MRKIIILETLKKLKITNRFAREVVVAEDMNKTNVVFGLSRLFAVLIKIYVDIHTDTNTLV